MEVGSLSANRNLIIIVLLVLELAVIPYYYFYHYVPMQTEIQKKVLVVQEKRRDVREIELTKRLLTETREEIERLKADIARLEKFFPQDVFIPRVLVLIENLALATHVEIDSIKPSSRRTKAASTKSKAKSGGRRAAPAPASSKNKQNQAVTFDSTKEYSQSRVDFKVNGSFQNIYNFMNELATFPKLVVVDRLSLSPQSSGSGSESEEMEGSAETGREIEVGGFVEINVDMPLTFYIQKQDTSKKLAGNSQQGETKPGL